MRKQMMGAEMDDHPMMEQLVKVESVVEAGEEGNQFLVQLRKLLEEVASS